jgi:hypothetical protein
VIVVRPPKLKQVPAEVQFEIGFHLTHREYADYLKTGFPFHQFVQPNPGVSTLRILVEDTSAAEVGSVIISLSEVK